MFPLVLVLRYYNMVSVLPMLSYDYRRHCACIGCSLDWLYILMPWKHGNRWFITFVWMYMHVPARPARYVRSSTEGIILAMNSVWPRLSTNKCMLPPSIQSSRFLCFTFLFSRTIVLSSIPQFHAPKIICCVDFFFSGSLTLQRTNKTTLDYISGSVGGKYDTDVNERNLGRWIFQNQQAFLFPFLKKIR